MEDKSCAHRQVSIYKLTEAALGHDLADFGAYCAIHGFDCPPGVDPDSWSVLTAAVTESGGVCSNQVYVPEHHKASSVPQ